MPAYTVVRRSLLGRKLAADTTLGVGVPPWFDPHWYSDAYEDGGAPGHAFEHYISVGVGEGRYVSRVHLETVERLLNPVHEIPYTATGAIGRALQMVEEDVTRWASRSREPLANRRAYIAGMRSAVLPVALVSAAVNDARQLGVRKVFYLSREGAFLASVHRLVADLIGADGIEPVHLAVSRRSTFGASLLRVDDSELGRLWTQYPDQSPADLLTSLSLNPMCFNDELAAVGVDPAERLIQIGQEPRVQQFLEAARPRLQALLRERRHGLVSYLRQHAFLGGRVLVCDLGWRGTIQDNLCHLLPSVDIHGRYLGLFEYLNPQPPNASKLTTTIDANSGDQWVFASPQGVLEQPWTATLPTVGHYTSTGEPTSGRSAGDGPFSAGVDRFQAGVRSAARAVGSCIGTTPPDELRDALVHVLQDYFLRPLGGVADIWFDAVHDDSFGAADVNPYVRPRPTLEMTSLPPERLMAHAAAQSTHWPIGYLRWLPVEVGLSRAAPPGAHICTQPLQ